uniref:BIG2 domain-containing protein n=1 Tax=Stylophora pistillata TaxID=50429 RepID=A0A2B4RBG1_STYPI
MGTILMPPALSGHTISSGAVTYSSDDTTVANVISTSGIVQAVGAGTANITATQAETPTHKAGSASYRIEVRASGRRIRFTTNIVIVYKGRGAINITEPTFTTPSSGKITYESRDTSIATVNKNTGKVTLTGTLGSAVILMTQAATPTHPEGYGGYEVQVRAKREVATNFYFNPTQVAGAIGVPFTELKPNNNGSPGKITYVSSDPSIAPIDANTGKISGFLKGGNVTITATIAEAETPQKIYLSSTASYRIFVLKKGVAAKLSSLDVTATLGSPFTEPTLSGHTVSTGKVSYTSEDTSIVTVDEDTGKVTLKKAGVTYINVRQATTPTYRAWILRYKITVRLATAAKRNVSIFFGTPKIRGRIGLGSFPTAPSVLGKNGSTGKITYTSSDTSIATVNPNTGNITDMLKGGRTTITANLAETATHKSSTATYELEVLKQSVNLQLSFYGVNGTLGQPVNNVPTLTGQATGSYKGVAAGAITYTSTNPSVVTVDRNTGALTTHSVGRAVIRIRQASTVWHLPSSTFYQVLITNPSDCGGKTDVKIGGGGRTYKVVEIKGKCWMAEPLRLQTGFQNGNNKRSSATDPYYYKNPSANKFVYYNWAAAVAFARNSDKPTGVPVPSSWGSKKIVGWHLPSDKEVSDAFDFKLSAGGTERKLPYRLMTGGEAIRLLFFE